MKICITAQGKEPGTQVDQRFGRCQYFFIIDTETGKTDIVENPNKDGMGGVGIQSAQFLAEKQVKTVLTGNVGPNAFQTLKAADIIVLTGVSGTIEEVLDKYKKGEYKSSEEPSVDSHFGSK